MCIYKGEAQICRNHFVMTASQHWKETLEKDCQALHLRWRCSDSEGPTFIEQRQSCRINKREEQQLHQNDCRGMDALAVGR